ncbi:MAG: hypothetical protein ACKOS8_00925 [Gemmataceae bacterium]
MNGYQKTLDGLKRFKKLDSDKKFDFSNTNQEIDQNLFHQFNTLDRALGEGKESFMACRQVIQQTLNEPRNQNPFNRSDEFQLRKALQDMDRLEQLDKDPALQPKIKFIFQVLCNLYSLVAPKESLNVNSVLKIISQAKAEVISLFGPSSYLNYYLTNRRINILTIACRRGEMLDIDLETECEAELAPLLNSEWSRPSSCAHLFCDPVKSGSF